MDELKDGPQPADLDDRILPWSQVKVISGLSRTTVWRLQKTGDFPPAVQVSRNRVGWWQSELLAWKQSRMPRRLPPPRAVEPAPAEPPRFRASAPARAVQDRPLAASRRPSKKAAAPPGQGTFDF